MAKLIILLCLFLSTACILPTQAIEFGNRINQTHKNVVSTVNGAIETFQKKTEAIVQDTVVSLNMLKEEGESLTEKVRSEIEEILSKVDGRIKEITERFVSSADVTECMSMAQRIKDIGLAILVKVSNCVTSKIDEGSGYIEKIKTDSQNFVKYLLNIIEKANECTKDSNSSLMDLICMKSMMNNVTMVIALRIPSVTNDMVRMSYLVNTLFPSLALCSAAGTVDVFLSEVSATISSIEACVNERANAYRAIVSNELV